MRGGKPVPGRRHCGGEDRIKRSSITSPSTGARIRPKRSGEEAPPSVGQAGWHRTPRKGRCRRIICPWRRSRGRTDATTGAEHSSLRGGAPDRAFQHPEGGGGGRRRWGPTPRSVVGSKKTTLTLTSRDDDDEVNDEDEEVMVVCRPGAPNRKNCSNGTPLVAPGDSLGKRGDAQNKVHFLGDGEETSKESAVYTAMTTRDDDVVICRRRSAD
jgi:hypothetical protein